LLTNVTFKLEVNDVDGSMTANVRGLPQGWYFIIVRPATEAD